MLSFLRMSLNEKINTYIGFSIKSGKIVYGYENVILNKKKAYLVLCDKALSENSLKKVTRFVQVKAIKMYLIDALSDYFGGRQIKCVAIGEEHLASAIEKELNNTVGGSN